MHAFLKTYQSGWDMQGTWLVSNMGIIKEQADFSLLLICGQSVVSRRPCMTWAKSIKIVSLIMCLCSHSVHTNAHGALCWVKNAQIIATLGELHVNHQPNWVETFSFIKCKTVGSLNTLSVLFSVTILVNMHPRKWGLVLFDPGCLSLRPNCERRLKSSHPLIQSGISSP